MELKDIGERGLIERIRKKIYKKKTDIIIGPGDDCASVTFPEDSEILLTTDSLIEGTHFNLAYSTPFQIGYKAMAVNFSDIASMGGSPRFVLLSLSIPEKIKTTFIDELFEGMITLSDRYHVDIVGGDISKSAYSLMISVTAIGVIKKGIAVKRNNAKTGDKIFVTGTAGDSAIGLKLLRDNKRYRDRAVLKDIRSETTFDNPLDRLAGRHLLPTPRVEEGISLVRQGVSSMIDLSDGLAEGIREITRQSGKGAKIYLDNLPVSAEAKEITALWGEDANSYALYGGEDYELLFTCRHDMIKDIHLDTQITEIGEITDNLGIVLIGRDGVESLTKEGFDHFK